MNIYLVCNAGMSTSVLAKKMRQAAEKNGIDAKVEAFSAEVIEEKKDEADVVLVGPQIRHMLPEIKKIVAGSCPVDVIDMKSYAMIDGVKVLDQALKLAGK